MKSTFSLPAVPSKLRLVPSPDITYHGVDPTLRWHLAQSRLFLPGDTQRHASHPQPSPPNPIISHTYTLETWAREMDLLCCLLIEKVDQKAEPTPYYIA